MLLISRHSHRLTFSIGAVKNTLVLLHTRTVGLPAAGEKCMCTELDALKREAVRVFREVKKIRRSRDVSFHEDAELNREKQGLAKPRTPAK
jgi:hypothetical protein